MKKRYLLKHDESDSVFEVYETEEGFERWKESSMDAALCDDVTGIEHWEERFKQETLTAQKERNNKGTKMTTTQVLRKLFIGIAAAFSEAAGEIQEVGSEATVETPAQEEQPKAKRTRASKKTAEAPKETKSTKKSKKTDEDEMEEVDSPYNDDTSSDDPADFDDEDDFAGMEEDEDETPVKEATVEDLRAALVAYAQKNTKEKAYKVLEKFGAKKANEVAKKDIAKAIAALKVK